MDQLITSRSNPKIAAAAKLLRPAESRAQGKLLLEGARLCADAAENGAVIEQCFYTSDAQTKFADRLSLLKSMAAESFEISRPVAERLSDTAGTQGVYCVCRRPQPAGLPKDGVIVITDCLQNPENLGAIARTAEAFGAAGLVAAGGADPFSPKALRASMGALLRLPVTQTDDAAETVRELRARGIPVFAAALGRNAEDPRNLPRGRAAVVIGNEGSGVSAGVIGASTACVTIPMTGLAESLNAAAAAAVLLWELLKDTMPPPGGSLAGD